MSRRLQEPNAETDPGALSPRRTLSPVPASLPQTSVLWRLLLTRRARPGPSRPAPPAGPARAPGSETTCPRSCSCSFSWAGGGRAGLSRPLPQPHPAPPSFSRVQPTLPSDWPLNTQAQIKTPPSRPRSSRSPPTFRAAPCRPAPRPRRPFQARFRPVGTGLTAPPRPSPWTPADRPRKPGPARPGPRSPTSMGSLAYREDLEEEKNSEFTWEVQANNRSYNNQFKEKVFLCWQRKKYKRNVIHTAKYNVFSFLPLNLYEQFHRMSNLYFLLIIILQGIPEISTLPWFTLFAPLVGLLTIRATRDLVDDIGRHRSDRNINNRPCQILMGKSFLWRKWKNLCVGDVVCLHKDSIVPADLVLLASTEPSSLCYVETADIDGETNLKFRQAPTITHHELTSIRKMASFQGKVVCEEPNSRMHHFVGCLEWKGKKYPLDSGNILLRGCKIRNTDTCYGLVIYAGFDTKIMKNCGKIHLKRTKIDHLMNRLVVLIFLSMVVISAVLTLGFRYKVREFKAKHHYVSAQHVRSEATQTFFIFWGFLVLLSVMVPMAMFILAEFIHLGNSIFINWDERMYYEPQDLPAKARSTSLNDLLGQVEYIFSDKTGTLTQNIMTFKKCCINGVIYGSEEEDTLLKEDPYLWNKFADGKLHFRNAELLQAVRANQDRRVREFWRVLAICHTVMVREKNSERPDQLLYQAASPDEEALVTAARNFGYVFLARTQNSITVMELGEERVYQVLAMMDFNSVRKRMSVLVRNPEGSIYLYTKGADTVIYERLQKKGLMERTTEEALASFAKQTLRTLCVACKEVDEDMYEEWRQRHQEASILLQNRAHALHQVYEEMEQNLQLLGATAIEDRLQDGVLDTIKCLKQGNIKVWVLTGDKQETAVNIGFACQLLSENMIILEEKEIVRILEVYWESNNSLQGGKKGHLKKQLPLQVKMALVINGEFLDQLLLSLRKEPRALVQNVSLDEEEPWQEPREERADFLQTRRLSLMWRVLGIQLWNTGLAPQDKGYKALESAEVRRERAFVELASRCQAVICCRVTPKQKALIVALVKKYQDVVTLAVGDGANDVSMIKTADIGVGLAGQEGNQAVQNSDYVLAQFCFLRRLLLVHGRWSYMRVCKFLRYFIYKTLASMMVQIWFAFYSGFTAQPLYEGWFLALFNLLYTTLPVLYIGLFEQDVSAERSLELPELYMAGQKDELFNYWVFLQAVAHGTATSLVNFFMTLWISRDSAGPVSFSDYQSFAVIVALSGLLSITMEIILITKYWTVLSVLAIFFSLGFYAVMTWLTQSIWLFKVSPKTFPFLYADLSVLSQPPILLVILLNVSLNTLPVLAFRIIYQALQKPGPKEEEEKTTSEEIITVEPIPHVLREARTRRSSYAFSHREGYADLITQGTILRRSPGVNSDMLVDHTRPPDELPSSMEESSWYPRKMSFLGRNRRQHQGKVSSEDVQPASEEKLPKRQERSLSYEPWPYTPESLPPTKETPLSAEESQMTSSESQMLSSSQLSLKSQSAHLQEKTSLWKIRKLSWKNWPYTWQKEPGPPKEGTVPVSNSNLTALMETPPPTARGSSTSEQPMEVEPSPVERQPSPMEWLPGPSEGQTPPDLAGLPPSPEEQQ
ncbi:phospholipid-transporting ATPase IK [Balaenoptera ricei]|uniref:phospholipid-transporting ATPase IK n=1 Tax=Balaenoptera ricei TaxID=2746895 RepID=UPI0028BF3C3D|nr:phospholipid-transporting ATPase IK [Balaenoptera ricei]